MKAVARQLEQLIADGIALRCVQLGSSNVREETFHSHGIALAGRLLMPAGSSKAPVVVLVHGAEQNSALDYMPARY